MMGIRKPFQMVLPEDLLDLSRIIVGAGFQLYVVGGAVRDAIMGVVPKDYDVATNATPDQVLALLKATAWKTDEVGKSFGVVRARNNGEEYEVATFRQDVGEGRRPDSVVFTTIEEDVKRRDFTINALFYDIQNQEIVDLVGGMNDIRLGMIRTVGDPRDRFREDRLRVLRAIRFASKLGYAIEDETYDAIRIDNNLDGVSPERIHDEFVKSVKSAKDPDHMFGLLCDFMMWPRVFPALDVNFETRGERSVPVMLALMLRDNEVPVVAKRLNELKYNDVEVRQTTFLMNFRDLKPTNAVRLRKAYVSCGISLDDLVTFCVHHPGGSDEGMAMVSHFKAYLDLAPVKGDDLLAEGYMGARLGEELQRREAELFRGLVKT